MSPAEGWHNTGIKEHVPGEVDRIPDYDPRSGEHLWCFLTTYQWNGDTENVSLDNENLLCIAGPGCYYCEEMYSPPLAKRRCKGHA